MMTKLNRTRAILWSGILLLIVAGSTWISAAKQTQGPTNLVAWDSGRYVQLNWDMDQDSRYTISRSDNGPDQWAIIKTNFPGTSFVDYDAPRSALIYYRVSLDNVEASNGAVVSISTTATLDHTLEQTLSIFDKNNIITDGELTDAGTMTAAQIQSFLTTQGSVLANYSSAGKTAAQRIYDDCQTHGINPRVVLVTLQKEKGLIKSASANPNFLAMGWNTSDSTTTDFANQIYYGTRQFRLYFNNLANYGWTVGQPHSVSDGTVTAANIATAGLYIYTPWIGEGGGGQTGVGGNYLFWDLWYNSFGFGEVSPAAVAAMPSGWLWPTGSSNFCGYLGWLGFSSTSGFHLAQDMCNAQGNPIYAIGDGDVILSRTDVSGYGPGGGPGGALIVRHQAGDGTWFTALYGHLNNPHAVGHVNAGDILGTSNAYNPPHLHFGIHPGFDPEPTNPWRGYTSSTSSTFGFVDPIPFLDAHPRGSSCTNGSTTLRNSIGGPPIHPPGTVIKIASSPTVYLIDADNKKRPITSASVLAQLYNQSTDARTSTNFSNWVITVAQDELDLYEQGGNLSAAQPGNGKPFPDGKLIGFNGEVSIVTGGGKRRPFADGSRFTGLGYSFCQVVNLTQTEYNSYLVGPPVDAMLMLVSSVSITPPSPYVVGQTINGSCGFRNVGYASITLSNIGIGGRFNGSTIYDIGFDSRTLAAGETYTFGPRARQLTSAGTYDFFATYQENNGHWALSVPASAGVMRRRQISASDVTLRTLTVASQNPASGVSISVSPNDNSGQGSGITQFNRTYNNGVVATVTASSTSGSNTFLKWQRDGIDVSSNLSTTVSMDANHTMTAVYSTPQTLRTLTVASTNPSSGVGITVSPADNNGQTGGTTQFALTYANSANVSLTAPATFGVNNFQKWQRDGVDLTSSATANVTMDADHTVTAVYVPPPSVTRNLTVASSPVNGVSISVSPNDNNGQGSGVTQFIRTYSENANVTFTAPLTFGGNSFQKWQRDGVDWSSSAMISVTADADHVFTAVYAVASTQTNFALPANGGSAFASSTINSSFPASGANNGDRRGLNWGAGGGWADGNSGVFPDWLEIDFNGNKSISEINVFTLQDNFNSPVDPTQTTTFSIYGLTSYEVQYWSGSSWITVPGGSITGNNKVWRQITFSPISTSRIRVLTLAALDNGFSRLTEVEAWGEPSGSPPPQTNFALLANGGTVFASSTINSGFPASGANNGDRRGTNWGAGGGWADGNSGVFPDWLEIDFNGNKSISEIDVFTLQDNFSSPIDPTTATTFSTYGLTSYEVQYWTGSSWITVPGGSITGNNKVWRQITFSPIVTSRIRVLTQAAADNGFSRLTEVEAWGEPSGPPPTQTNFAFVGNGGSAFASSTITSGFPASGANNGDRRGTNWGAGGGWADGNSGVFPDWLEIDFISSKTITEIDVFTLQDNFSSPIDPTTATTFSTYGLTSYEVQYWTGSNWITVPGGSITGNNKVWRQITFSPIITSRIRVLTQAAPDNGFSRLTEVEAWGPAGP